MIALHAVEKHPSAALRRKLPRPSPGQVTSTYFYVRIIPQHLRALHLEIPYQVRDKLLNSLHKIEFFNNLLGLSIRSAKFVRSNKPTTFA